MMNAECCVAGPTLLDWTTNLTWPKPKSNGGNENSDDSWTEKKRTKKRTIVKKELKWKSYACLKMPSCQGSMQEFYTAVTDWPCLGFWETNFLKLFWAKILDFTKKAIKV